MIDRVGQTWKVDYGVYLFVRSWKLPDGTGHELLSIDDGTSEEWIESSNHGPLEWRKDWKRVT